MKKINPNIQIIDDAIEDELVIKISNSTELFKLSTIEYDIIAAFSTNNDFDYIISLFKEKFIEIEKNDLISLINIAEKNNILITDNTSKIRDKNSFFNIIILGINFTIVFKRQFKMFELINIDFTNTLFEKFFENRKNQLLIFGIIFLVSTLFLIDIISNPLNFKSNYLETINLVPVSFSSIIIYIYIASFLSVFVHEFGHYIVYKYKKGKSSIFGIGLLYFILPSAYCKIFNSLIPNLKDRVIINISGVIFDFIFLISILFFTKYFHSQLPTTSFILYCILISIAIRTFINLNIFLPGTDGYFILSDILNKPNLFSDSKNITKNLITGNLKFNINLSFFIIYYLLSILSILIASGFMLFPIILYLFYN